MLIFIPSVLLRIKKINKIVTKILLLQQGQLYVVLAGFIEKLPRTLPPCRKI